MMSTASSAGGQRVFGHAERELGPRDRGEQQRLEVEAGPELPDRSEIGFRRGERGREASRVGLRGSDRRRSHHDADRVVHTLGDREAERSVVQRGLGLSGVRLEHREFRVGIGLRLGIVVLAGEFDGAAEFVPGSVELSHMAQALRAMSDRRARGGT